MSKRLLFYVNDRVEESNAAALKHPEKYPIDTILYTREIKYCHWYICVQYTFPVYTLDWEPMDIKDVPKDMRLKALLLT